MKKHNIEVGNRVAYSAKFCKSIGCFTGDLPRLRGTVKEIRTYGKTLQFAVIEWDGSDKRLDEDGKLPRVNVFNLARVGSAKFACNDL